jgi:hypothetical protein
MARTIKKTAIPLGGYLYQNLVGVELLCDWLEDPSLYAWVKFESDDEEIPKGLDDIVAQRQNGALVMLQVKFTVDPFDTNNHLSWDWLLQHKPKGKSLLQKWSDAFFSVESKRLVEAALVTNRLPDREFSSCFDNTKQKISLSKVSQTILDKILEQLHTQEKIVKFFEIFEFQHSQQSDQALERTLLNRYVPNYTDHHGWLQLNREVIDWALRENFPLPDGRISLGLVRGVLNSNRPAPLDQSFHIPISYNPPDEDFSRNFVSHLTTTDKATIILWGSPGQGKSTYLSHVCSQLEMLSVPFIRHHYFLSLNDGSDRFSLMRVANSLMSQMEANHVEYVRGLNNDVENLRAWIEACANGYAAVGKRFIVVIDGLDHVWRENEHNKQPLDTLFQCLFPAPKNVTLLIGTQKVADDQLPACFTKFVTRDDWIEIPRMSLLTIRGWLEGQLAADTFTISDQGTLSRNDPLTEIAESFQHISGGHPLILTYCFMSLAREKRVLTAEMINEYPIRPDGDIKQYYRSLWQRLSYQAKDALHIVADTGFIWPSLGLETCLNVRVGELGREIDHLFYITDAGQVAFHGSLLTFIIEDIEHSNRITNLLPRIVNWLDSDAPNFHRWGWLWLYKARAGDSDDLVRLPTRQWVIDSLAKAYPDDQIVEILSGSERFAFEAGDFDRAVWLRWLKIRVLNGKDFQIDDYERLHKCSLKLTSDDYPLKVLAANHHTATIDRLHLLGILYLSTGRVEDARDCLENIRRRINDGLKAHAFSNDSLEDASEKFLELAAATGQYKPDQLLKSIRNFKTLAPSLFRFFLNELSKRMDIRLLMDFVNIPMPIVMRRDLELATIRLAGICQARIQEWPDFAHFKKHPISMCWKLIYAPVHYKSPSFNIYDSSLDVKTHDQPAKDYSERYLHNLFFFALAQCLELHGANSGILNPEYKNRLWFNTAVKHILNLANNVGKILARNENPSFAMPYRLLDSIPVPESYESFNDYVPFRRALLTIATDIFLLVAPRTGLTEIPIQEWCAIRKSKHFIFSEWLDRYVKSGNQLLSSEIIEDELKQENKKTAESISPFNERLERYVELCELAIHQQLWELAEELLKKALSCVIAYGWRKDPTLSNVIDAITEMSKVDAEYAKSSLILISPIVSNIDDMTEDDGVRKSDLAELLLKLMPSHLATYYEYWLNNSEWYAADLVFADLFTAESLTNPLINFVTSSVWDTYSIGRLKEMASSGNTTALSIVKENALRFGQSIEELGKGRLRDSSYRTDEPEIDVRNYLPEALSDLLEELKHKNVFVAQRDVIQQWFSYWRGQHKNIDLLRAIEPYLDQENGLWGVADLFDQVFELSLALEGKSKAYRWLVAAQIHCNGWGEHYSQSNALNRFKVFASNYPRIWEKFIKDTAKQTYKNSSETILIPHLRLVQFLIVVGQIPLAKNVTEQMIVSVVEDFADQPLKKPTWLELSDTDIEPFSHIGISRLKLPCPMAKLQITHGLAKALSNTDINALVWSEMLSWVHALNLESEIIEALCSLVLANNSNVVSISAIRTSIRWPSILSDVFLSQASRSPTLVNSWAKSHSGEAPEYYRADAIQAELMKGQIVPPILANRLERLEDMTGNPMIKQWVYEFDRLICRVGQQSNDHFSYFIVDDRERSTGQFIGKRGHLARSAYLRTLAFAYDYWGMPENLAISEAMYASPADFSFLRMLPSNAPQWVSSFKNAQPNSSAEWESWLTEVLRPAPEQQNSSLLVHLNVPLNSNLRYQADFEMITILFSGSSNSVKEIFGLHDWLIGQVYIDRSTDWNFIIEGRNPDAGFPINNKETKVLPALLPSIGRYVGYMHADIIGRMPYLPANYSKDVLIAKPREGGADLEYNGLNVGEFRYWNCQWSPTHDKDLGTHGGVSVSVSFDCVSQLLNVPEMQLTRVWRSTVLKRESDYGEWQKETFYGTLST